MTDTRVPLRLLKSFGIWNAGEIAGFPPEQAAAFVAQGFADWHGTPPEGVASGAAPAVPADEGLPETVTLADGRTVDRATVVARALAVAGLSEAGWAAAGPDQRAALFDQAVASIAADPPPAPRAGGKAEKTS